MCVAIVIPLYSYSDAYISMRNKLNNRQSRNSSFHHSILFKEEAFTRVKLVTMYDNARQKITLTIIIFLMLIACFAGDTWMIWVSGLIWLYVMVVTNIQTTFCIIALLLHICDLMFMDENNFHYEPYYDVCYSFLLLWIEQCSFY